MIKNNIRENTTISLCGRSCNRCKMKINNSCSGCSMCDISFCGCNKEKKKRCLVRCPSKIGTFNMVGDIQDNYSELLENKSYDLPDYIPVMPDKISQVIDFSNIKNIVAIHGEFLLSASGERISPVYRQKGFIKALNLPNECSGIAEFYIKDRALEGFWSNRKFLYQQLKSLNFLGIITPNFSLYEDAPRIEHIYNIQRVKSIYNEMITAGLPAILDIVWATNEDLEYWIKEINKSNIKTIAFSFMNVDTRLKASNAWRHYLLGYEILTVAIDKDIEIIIAGISSINRVKEIMKISKDRKISIMHQAAWVNSRKGFVAKLKKQVDRSITKDEIFTMNLKYYQDKYNGELDEV